MRRGHRADHCARQRVLPPAAAALVAALVAALIAARRWALRPCRPLALALTVQHVPPPAQRQQRQLPRARGVHLPRLVGARRRARARALVASLALDVAAVGAAAAGRGNVLVILLDGHGRGGAAAERALPGLRRRPGAHLELLLRHRLELGEQLLQLLGVRRGAGVLPRANRLLARFRQRARRRERRQLVCQRLQRLLVVGARAAPAPRRSGQRRPPAACAAGQLRQHLRVRLLDDAQQLRQPAVLRVGLGQRLRHRRRRAHRVATARARLGGRRNARGAAARALRAAIRGRGSAESVRDRGGALLPADHVQRPAPQRRAVASVVLLLRHFSSKSLSVCERDCAGFGRHVVRCCVAAVRKKSDVGLIETPLPRLNRVSVRRRAAAWRMNKSL